MSLVKSPHLTEKRLAALRRNARLSRGPRTREGLERIRAAKLRHGWYSRVPGAAFRVLGDDLGEVARLREELHREWNPTDILQEWLVDRLALAFWRFERTAELSALAPRLVDSQRPEDWSFQQIVRNTHRLLDLKRQERQLAMVAGWTSPPPAEKIKKFRYIQRSR